MGKKITDFETCFDACGAFENNVKKSATKSSKSSGGNGSSLRVVSVIAISAVVLAVTIVDAVTVILLLSINVVLVTTFVVNHEHCCF